MPADDALTRTLDLWCRSLVDKDTAVAADLRDRGYTVVLRNGDTMTREQELALMASPESRVTSAELGSIRLGRFGKRATATLRCVVVRETEEVPETTEHTLDIELVKRHGRWRAIRARLPRLPEPAPVAQPNRLLTWLRERARAASFQNLAYLPYRPGEDFALSRMPVARAADDALPVPPRELWLGYDYPAHGGTHVDAMLALVGESGCTFREGDRILDFGCGAGRMIRHLQRLAATCEIWGTDISAEHILWCKRNLSPPFHFATTTKVPHLPFEDRSFRLVYGGSVFTHIDDLADAWLLELHRILAPDGRVYVTIHDEHTVQLLEEQSRSAAWLARVRKYKVYREAKDAFDMISIGRDERSQVFYSRDYFCRMASSAFDVVSITPEAYFYQTALVLKRKAATPNR